MIYVYKNNAGDIREVTRPMTSPPPERIAFEGVGYSEFREADDDDFGSHVFSRVWIEPAVKVGNDGATQHTGAELPVSMSMPLARGGTPCTYHGKPAKRLACGAYATPDGYRIVDNKANRDRHMKDTGYVDEA